MVKWLFSSRWGRALLTAVFLTSGGTFVGVKNGGHMSPGPLSAAQVDGSMLGGYASHASFEQECTHCHAPMHCITADRCQSCHIDIAEQRQKTIGLHGRLPATTRCQTCHIEHQGREAHITDIPLANLDHAALAQFDLARHRTNYDGLEIKCCDCHREGRLEAAAVDCTTCHETAEPVLMADHLALYGPNCVTCHDGRDQMADFDHETVYQLTDAHAAADCVACHENHLFAGTPTTCDGCHAEPEIHLGAFGTDCTRCHATRAWVPARLVLHTFLLQHGSEDIVPCQTCHQKNYTDYPCYACHDMLEMQVRHNQQQQIIYENCVDGHPTGRINQEPVAGANEGSKPGAAGVPWVTPADTGNTPMLPPVPSNPDVPIPPKPNEPTKPATGDSHSPPGITPLPANTNSGGETGKPGN